MALVVTIEGVDRSAVVQEDTIKITQLADSFTFTAELTVFDENSNISITAGSHQAADEVTLVDGAVTFFGGYVANQDIQSGDGGSRNLNLQCQGFGILLNETLVEYEEYEATADDAIIDDLFDTYLATIDSDTEVAQLDASMDISFTEMSLAEIMEAICQRTGGRFYVDNDKVLHYFADENDACEFDLSDEPDNVDTFSYYYDTELRVDASQIVNRVRVIGADGYTVTRNNAASQAIYGVRAAIITDQSLTTTAELEERGDAILTKHKDPKRASTVRTAHAEGTSPRAGQEIDYKNDVLGLDDTLTIRELYIYWEQGEPVYEMVLGEPVIFGLRRNTYTATQLRQVTIDLNPLAQRGWSHDLVFSATDEDTVAWAGGSIKLSGGTGSFTIAAGNTGNIAALTFVYLDTDVSLTALQTSTSAADALGANKILVAVCKNVASGDCEYQVFGGEEHAADFLFASDAAVNQLIANVLGANSIVVSAANIETGIIKNLHVSSTYADRIQANKIRIGPELFSPDDGLLLLGQPLRLERAIGGTTNYWTSTRGQRATIGAAHATPGSRGSVQPVQGKWKDSVALQLLPGTTNHIKNPVFGVNVTDAWTFAQAGAGGSVARDTTHFYRGLASAKIVADDTTYAMIYHDNIALADGETIVGFAYCKRLADVAARVMLRDITTPANVATTNASRIGVWEYLEVSWTNDTGGAVNIRFQLQNIEADGAGIVYFDGCQVEVDQDAPTALATGDMGDGFSWATAHNSTTTRTAGYLILDDHVTLLEGNNTWSIACVVQAPYDADGVWPAATHQVWDIAKTGDNNNRVFLTFKQATDDFSLYVNGGTRCTSVRTFKAGEHIQIVATLDFTNDEYKLYVNGVLEDTDTTALTAPAGLTNWNIGANYADGVQAGWALSELAVFDDILTEQEISDMHVQNRPTVDLGPMDTPGICLTSLDGSRIEISAYEIAVFEDNDKCVEIDDDGIAILVSTAFEDIRSYQFVDSAGAVISQVKGRKYTVTPQNVISMVANVVTGYDSIATVEALSPAGEQAQAELEAYHGAGSYATVSAEVSAANVSSVTIVVDGNIQAYADTAGLRVYGMLGEVWRFRDVAAGADRANTHRFHIQIDGTSYTLHGETGWV